MKRLAPKHPLAVRWFHWLNFPLLALMVWSGILIYWANPIYRVGWGSHTLLRMQLSQRVYQLLHLNIEGCTEVQGRVYSMPVPANEVHRLLQALRQEP